MTSLRCAKHGIEMQIDQAGQRKWTASSVRGSGSTLCGLLLAADPKPGRLYITDPDSGRQTNLYCDVEEETR